MKYLIKRYYYFLCEYNRPGKVFPNSLNRFYQPGNKIQFILLKGFPYSFKKPVPCTRDWLFYFKTPIKRYYNEEERLNFNY